MLGFIVAMIGALALLWIFNTYRSFSRNLAAAKSSHIPYVCVPIYMFNIAWLLSHRLFRPYLQKLPRAWTRPWLDVLDPEWGWIERHNMFRELGTDTFLTVAPGNRGLMLWTADANAISQITTRRNDFPKPIYMYNSVNIFGKNVVSTEGQIWRHHRKVVSPPFTERNNQLVWLETLRQTQDMLESWVGEQGDHVRTIATVADDTMRLSLHVISRTGFGVGLLWPGLEQNPSRDTDKSSVGRSENIKTIGKTHGHNFSYTDSLQTLLHNLLWVMLLPRFLLNNLPFKNVKIARESYREWGMYMNEMMQTKKADLASGKEIEEGLDLMGALVKGLSTSPLQEKNPDSQELTEQEILGNSFVFILAGHETAANSIHFSMVYLACNIVAQRRLQSDLDSIHHGRPISEWDYENDLPKLFNGMAGAVMNEELRLVPPVVTIPKSTLPKQPQTLVLDGKKCIVPGGVLVNLISTAVHRNPNFWPTGPPSAYAEPDAVNDLEEFKPERWLVSEQSALTTGRADGYASGQANGLANGHANGHANSHANGHTLAFAPTPTSSDFSDLGVTTSADTSAHLYQPRKGAYIPFSEGYRACIGRRFAQVEILAALAVIFSQYSVELAVDEFASDQEVEAMSEDARTQVWEKARRSTVRKMRGLESLITLQMRKERVGLRFVRKGRERFGVGRTAGG